MVFFTRGAQRPSGTVQPDNVTLLITLGLGAKAVEAWDGSVTVTGGALISVEGRHFDTNDAITGPASWRAATRRDAVAPYANIHYTEMRPGSVPEELFFPAGLYVTLPAAPGVRVAMETKQGDFSFALDEIGDTARTFVNGRASVVRVPSPAKLTTTEFEDDEPAIAALPDGSIAVAWVAYRERGDRILMRTLLGGVWSAVEEITSRPAEIQRCALVAGADGSLWVFWSQRDHEQWHIWARQKSGGVWQLPARLMVQGSNSFPRAAVSPEGDVFVTWQSFRKGRSDIYIRVRSRGAWSEEILLSESPANDWEPAIAAGPGGIAHVAWDSYDRGNYDIHFRSWQNGQRSPLRVVTSSPKFQAHASVAVDPQGRPWVAWNESGVNWGKDQGFLIVTPLAVPLHHERSVRVAMWDGARWLEPRQKPSEHFPEDLRENAEHPQIAFDASGRLVMMFRHWTRRASRMIGSPQVWENYLTGFDGEQWEPPQPLPHSGSWIEKHAGLARAADGRIWAAWMSDNRPFTTMIPQNAEVYAAVLKKNAGGTPAPPGGLRPFTESTIEAIPVHPAEDYDVKAIRDYSIAANGKTYRIYRGDMHRHTDISADFKYDGSLLEIYRYGLDVAGFDYIAATDHQTGFDQEYSWWQNQKLVDLFLQPGSFTPLFAYERSLRFPNGHRNVVFAHRGVRTLPIPPEEAQGKTGAANLFAYLRANRGISMPHTSATDQGTDWRDNDPEVEPLMEIYQGYRASYEYEGAPKAATRSNMHAQKSGWQPSGFWWNALAKGYKLGVQASSDHWSTHISYACLLAESFTREGLLDAIRKRHAYAATDNIILDFRAQSGGSAYIMGDVIRARSAPQLSVRVIGTGEVQQVDVIKNQTFVYTARPATKEVRFDFADNNFRPGRNYYYVRVLQRDGQTAWSSPIWVE